MDFQRIRTSILVFAFLLLAQVSGRAQSRNLTVAVMINSQNTSGYNPSSSAPGEFQRFAERYLTHLQVPYEIFDVATAAPPADLNSRQLIIAGHSRLLLPVSWRNAIATAVNAGTGFVNLDSDGGIGNESHIQTIFGATGSTAGTAATQIVIPPAVAPNGATPHYIAALQKKFDDPNLVYPFHAAADGVVRSAKSTLLTNATGTVIALLGNDPLILAKTYGTGRAVHFGTLDYLRADRFGFLMGVDDLFWRSLVWAARKPFVVRGYPRLWTVQMDDQRAGWGSRVRDMYDPTLTGQTGADGIGGPWKVTGYLFTDNLAPATTDRTNVIADINAGKLEVSPHSFADVALGNMYWNGSSGPLTDSQWLNKMSAIDTWKQGNGGADTIPSLSRSMLAHFWDLSNNTGYDLWNHYGFRYITAIQKPGFAAPDEDAAARLPARPFWLYEMPPKTEVSPSYTTENYPLFFADDYVVGSRLGLPSQTFFLFATQYTDFARIGRVDFSWPDAWPTSQTVTTSIAQLQQYTWRHWSSLDPLQLFTHDAINYENSTDSDRRSVISGASSWLNANGAKHVFMDDLGDYIYARTKSTLTRVTSNGPQLTYTFTGTGATADGNPVSTQALVFQGDNEGVWQVIPGFTNGLQLIRDLPPSIQSVTPSSGPMAGGTAVTISGTGFAVGTTVFFGPNAASAVTFVNSSTLQAVTPAGIPGGVDVKIISPNGNATLPGGFTYVAPPPSCPCSVWTSSTVPANVDSGDAKAVELGVTFRSDVSGYITGIRFYKSLANTGTHTGHLWTNTGTLLASATFTGETASGWQQVNFASAVAITAGTTYIASYFAPNSHYSRDVGYFASTGADNGPLHFVRDGIEGGNGVYSYGATSSFPTSSFQSTNYWVDVVFNTTPPGPSVLSMSPASGASGVSPTTTVRAVFSQELNPATVTNATVRLLDASNNPLPASVSYNAGASTATLTPTSALLPGSTYKAVITGGSSGVKNTSGTPMSSDVSWLFTTAQPVNCPCSIWTSSAIPSTVDSGGTTAVELGVKFRSDVDGYLTGIRFYKSSANTGTHIGHLWNSTGTLLTSATFTGETASGWQQVTFPSPVAITAGTTYVASYFAPNGHYSVDLRYFASTSADNAPLHLLQDGVDGANGVYVYGTGTTFPTSTYLSSNYWIDVVFNTTPGSPAGPTVLSMSPISGAAGVSIETSVSAGFSQDLNPATVTSATFRLLDSSNNPVPASVAYNAGSAIATLTPTSALLPTSTYKAVITGGSSGVKNISGTPMSADVSWLFTTAQSVNCPCSIWTPSATPSTLASTDGAAVEVGVRFRSDVSGYITALRFYKGSTNTGTHVGNLWSNSGALLASATFTGETASGWQQVNFPSPVAITAGTTYVASYFAPNGHYALDFDYFASTGTDNLPLHLLRDGLDGVNGAYSYSATTSFPTSTFRSSNYWVDVVFNTTATQTTALGSLSVNPTSVQGGSSSTGTVTLTAAAPSGGAIVVLSSSDATAASVPANVTVPAGATTATFTISTSTVSASTAVTISGSYQGQQTATLTVTPAGAVSVSNLTLNPTSVISGATSAATITLSSPAPPTTGAVVALSSDNTSAATVPATVTIAAGATTGTFTVTALSVSTSTPVTISASYNGVKTAILSVNAAGGTLSALSLSPTSVVSGATSTGTVTLASAAPAGGAVVALSSADTSVATVPANITVAAGATSATFPVATSGVSTNSTIAISATYSGASRSANLTVTPAVLLSLSISPTTVRGGVSSTATVTLNGNAPTAGAVIALSTANAAATIPASMTIPAGQKTGTFTITTVPVSNVTTGAVSGTYNSVVKTSATLTVNPPALSSIGLAPRTLIGGASSTGTVTLTGATAAAETVALSTTNTAATSPINVTIPAGASTATFTVTTVPVSATATGTVSGTYRGLTRTSATLTVNPPTLSTLVLNPTTVVGGSPSTATVTLTGVAASDTTISVVSNRIGVIVPSSVVVPGGAQNVSFGIITIPVAANTTATISATYNGVTRNASLSVRAPQLASITLNPTSVTMGNSATGTATLTGPAPSTGTSVSLSSSNRLVATVPSSALVPAGQTSITFLVRSLLVGTATITGTRGVSKSATLTVRLN